MDESNNVRDLSEHRQKRKLTLGVLGQRKGAMANIKPGTKKSKSIGPRSWWHYAQFLFFLGILSYFMSLCSRG